MSHRRMAAAALLVICLLVNTDISNTVSGSGEESIFLPLILGTGGVANDVVTLRGTPVSGQPVTMTVKNLSGSVDLVTHSGPDGHYTFQPSPEMLLADTYQVSWKSTGIETGLLISWTCNEVAGPPGNQPLCGFDIGGVPPLAPLSYEPLDLPITFTWETRGLPGEGYRLVFIDDEDGKKIDLNMEMTTAGSYTLTTFPAQLLHDHSYHWGLTVHGSNGSGEAGEYGLVKFR